MHLLGVGFSRTAHGTQFSASTLWILSQSVSQVWRQVHLPTELSCRAGFIFEAGYEVVQAERKHLF